MTFPIWAVELFSKKAVRGPFDLSFGKDNHQIKPPTQDGVEGSVRSQVTKNPVYSFSGPLPDTRYVVWTVPAALAGPQNLANASRFAKSSSEAYSPITWKPADLLTPKPTNHIGNGISFNFCSLSGLCVHPVQVFEVPLERVCDVVDHDFALGLRFAVKYFSNKHGSYCESWGWEKWGW